MLIGINSFFQLLIKVDKQLDRVLETQQKISNYHFNHHLNSEIGKEEWTTISKTMNEVIYENPDSLFFNCTTSNSFFEHTHRLATFRLDKSAVTFSSVISDNFNTTRNSGSADDSTVFLAQIDEFVKYKIFTASMNQINAFRLFYLCETSKHEYDETKNLETASVILEEERQHSELQSLIRQTDNTIKKVDWIQIQNKFKEKFPRVKCICELQNDEISQLFKKIPMTLSQISELKNESTSIQEYNFCLIAIFFRIDATSITDDSAADKAFLRLYNAFSIRSKAIEENKNKIDSKFSYISIDSIYGYYNSTWLGPSVIPASVKESSYTIGIVIVSILSIPARIIHFLLPHSVNVFFKNIYDHVNRPPGPDYIYEEPEWLKRSRNEKYNDQEKRKS